jgi:glycosyltransferase involved in cell wall biosynthesis
VKKKIFYVSDSFDWVQGKRLALFKRYLPEFDFEALTFKKLFSLKNWLSLRKANIYFTSWRSLIHYPSYLKQLNPEKCIVSITSHYNLGGGLNEKYALPSGMSPEAAIDQATKILKLFDFITVNSKILHDFLSPWIKTTILENGVDHRLFRKKRMSPFNPEAITIGWTGKVKAAKNYEDTIQPAFQKLAKEGFRIHNHTLLKNATASSIKSPDEMVEYYNQLDFYICASWHEGTPNPALEAASCGVPVITTRVGNMPELIQDGVNGGFIEPNPHSLVEKLLSCKNLSNETYQDMSSNARHSIEQNWTWDIKFQKIRDYFHRVFLND